MDKLLRAREVAAATGLPKSTVYRLAQRGELPHVKFLGKSVRFPESAVERWIAERLEASGAAVVGDAQS
ncbi:MAG: helix-turn-helix transcriptional regulator [Anaerolineae bacterium]